MNEFLLTSFRVSLISCGFILLMLTLFNAYVFPSVIRVTLVTAAKAPLPIPPCTLKSFIPMMYGSYGSLGRLCRGWVGSVSEEICFLVKKGTVIFDFS